MANRKRLSIYYSSVFMSKNLFVYCIIACLFNACKSGDSLPSTDLEAAKQFVDHIWRNDFNKAERLLLNDEANHQTFDGFRVYYSRLPQAQRNKYKNATLVLNNVTQLNDSVSMVNYSPDFNKTEKNELKIVRTNGQWYVDLKPESK